jgi:twinkle protein
MAAKSAEIVVKREQCPECLDSGGDNLAIYADGHAHCFGCEYHVNATGETKPVVNTYIEPMIEGTITELSKRALNLDTSKFFNIQVGKYSGRIGNKQVKDEPVKIFNYYDEKGNVVAQKIKTQNKEMKFLGRGKEAGLYGKWKWSPNEKLFVTVVEGEEDACALAQSQGYQYPVVSLQKGATSAKKDIEKDLQFLLGFKYVVLAFDNDEVGQKGMQSCLDLFEPGKVKIATWKLKDANEMLIAGLDKELRETPLKAKAVIPESSVTIEDILDQILIQPEFGLDYPWPTLSKITYGMQPGQVNVIVGATGVGKTEFVKDLMFHFIDKGQHIGLFSFEQKPADTARRLIGAKMHSKLWLPGNVWDAEKIKETALQYNNKIFLYDKAGQVKIQDIFNCIRFWAKAYHVKVFFFDNLKALGISNDNEKASHMMNDFKSLMNELGTTIFLLSHVSKYSIQLQTHISTVKSKHLDPLTAEEVNNKIQKPGLEWETGRIPAISHIEGSNTVAALSDLVLALARNRMSDDDLEKKTLKVKVLKNRLDSQFDGVIFDLVYSKNGRLEELNANDPF